MIVISILPYDFFFIAIFRFFLNFDLKIVKIQFFSAKLTHIDITTLIYTKFHFRCNHPGSAEKCGKIRPKIIKNFAFSTHILVFCLFIRISVGIEPFLTQNMPKNKTTISILPSDFFFIVLLHFFGKSDPKIVTI